MFAHRGRRLVGSLVFSILSAISCSTYL